MKEVPEGIRKVCVIGAGVMGAGIAAQVANAGVPVLLLDIVRDPADRNSVARGAVETMLRADPAPFMSKAAAKLVEVGNIDDDLAKVAGCDWIVEAIVERLDLKQGLYAKLEGHRAPHAAVSSNTSTIPLAQLIEGRSEGFRGAFIITHFFNPPRYMRLLEFVTGPHGDPAIAARVADFVDRALGKRIVRAKDSPGFIANRIGTFWVQSAINAAFDLGLTVEEADAIAGKPMGVPATGVFGLMDLVGLDLMPHVRGSLLATLPADDAYRAIARDEPRIAAMLAAGQTGRKGKGGFYRLNPESRAKEAIDLATGEYRPAVKAAPPPEPAGLNSAGGGDLAALLALPGKPGAYAWAVLGPTLAYAASLAGTVADDIAAIDDAMKLGYNWRLGPFELIDRLGAPALAARLAAEGLAVPPILALAGDRPFHRVEQGRRQVLGLDGAYRDLVRPAGVLLLEDLRLAGQPLLANQSASLWDVGDGIVALEFHAKMNALDGEIMALIGQAIALVQQKFKALVIYNEGANFSAGANLGLALMGVAMGAWDKIAELLVAGQNTYKALKYAPFPVVAAPAGMALGGGCEILLHADAIQAHAESYVGLVECGVGLVPGWGGNGEMLARWQAMRALPRGPMPAVARVFEIVSVATVSRSAAEARELGFLRADDGITMNRDRVLGDAKARALAMVDGYAPPAPPEFRLPGPAGRAALALAIESFRAQGLASEYDAVVAGRLADVLTGGATDPLDVMTEADLLALEREAFLALLRDERTQARVRHMLETGKPLRN
jgi:3-hydroxyacyl-CoA dehydrogenase